MTVRMKALLTIGLTMIVLVGILYAVSQYILLGSFDELEDKNTRQNIERAVNSYNDHLADLDTILFDWSSWDDTYEFVEDLNADYIDSNLVDTSFTGIPLNLIVYLNSSGEMVYSKAFDLEEEEEIPLPSGLVGHLGDDSALAVHTNVESSTTGVLLLDEGPMMIASRPILNSEIEGPIRGTMIMGRYLDSAEVETLAALTELSLAVHQLDDPKMPADFETARSALSQEEPRLIRNLGEESVAGYALLSDVYGNPALILGVNMPRDIYQQGQTSNTNLMISVLAVGLVFIVLTLLLLEKVVLSRLARLSRSVASIGEKGDISARVSMPGTDELSSLGVAINGMLAELEESHEELRLSEAKNRVILETIPDSILQVSKDGTLLNFKPSKDDDMSIPPSDLLGKNMSAVMPDDAARQAMQHMEQAIRSGGVEVFEYPYERRGEKRNCEARMVVSGENEVLAILRDTTDRKRAEDAERKEVLLHEIHHRVKNNLQVISSLLKLQSGYVEDERVLEMFKDTQNRIKSMTLIHEKLYRPEDMTGEIDFGEYVRDLATQLLRSHGTSPGAVKLTTEVDSTAFNLDTAIPCGLLVNELVSNALKHAFPDGNEGEIRIGLTSRDDGRYELVVGDNGAGLPEGLDFRNTESLGLQLVMSLVDQLGGNIELGRDGGTVFKVEFTRVSHAGDVLQDVKI